MKYVAKDGAEKDLASIADCVAAIGSGALTADSMVRGEAGWIKASEHPELASLLRPSRSPVESTAQDRLRTAAWATWIVGLLILPVVEGAQGGSVAYALGQAIGAAMLVGIIGAVALFFVRNRATLGLVLGLFLCLADLGLVGEQMAARARLHESARRLQDSLLSSPSSASHASAATAGGASPANSAHAGANLLDLAADMVNESRRLNEELLHQSQVLDARTLIAPGTLVSQTAMRAGLGRLDAWIKYLDSYVLGVDRLEVQFETKAMALAATDAQRASFRSTLNTSWAETKRELGRFLDLERQANVEVRALYAFMGDRAGLVRVANNKLLFVTSADVDTYSKHIQRLRSLAAEETQALAGLRQRYDDGMTKLRQAASEAASR